MDRPIRKPMRLKEYDYSTPGMYFVTICTEGKQKLLSNIVGGGALDAPIVVLTKMGKIAHKYILSSNRIPGVTVDKFVIMPNHIHLILVVEETAVKGTSMAPSPTNAAIPHFVSTFKRFCHREIGGPIFQRSYYDHVIRSKAEYREIWQYIDSNPDKWMQDRYYEG